MADFRKLSIDLIAANGKIVSSGIKVLKKSLYADDRIELDEIQFLSELRNAVVNKAKKKATHALDKFFLKAIEDHILQDGVVSADEVSLLQAQVFADKRLVKGGKKLAESLKKKATSVPPELDALLGSVKGKKKKG
ncbi:MAG: hypothetical protein EXS09_08785 [Gemmataceae bacterium]|nr:hypothetical protein [Gemmataceae bacterium]